MIPTGSRYEDAEHNYVFNHAYSKRGFVQLEGEEGMRSLKPRVTVREALYRMQTEPDPIGETVTYFPNEMETLQFLGHKVFDDPRRWTEIADLNPHVWYPLDLKPGVHLVMPLL